MNWDSIKSILKLSIPLISTKSVLYWCLLSYSLELNLFAVPGTEGKFSFLHLFVAPFSDIFFASSCRIGRFVSGAFQGRRGWKYKVFRKNTTQRCGDFFENRRLDLLFPKPAAIPLHLHDNDWCHRKDHVEERKSERQWNDKFLWSFWVTRLSHTYFWEMDTTSSCKCFGKMEIVYVGTCKTKLYGKSRNGVSFDRLACNRQKETLFLMPYYWDMKGWRATVSCRLDCAIKNGTASCGYKSCIQYW